ncbi:MAG: T9SS type A sorting domain-containing protein, partial [bacterium]
ELHFGTSNIIRHIRVRGSMYEAHTMQGVQVQKVILDHVSVSWGGDESLSFWDYCQEITLQWCTFEESVGFWHSEGAHNYGPMITINPGGTPSGNYSFHHNLITHMQKRCPLVNIGKDFFSDVRNNVIADCGGGMIIYSFTKYPSSGSHNAVNNYMKKGPCGHGTNVVHFSYSKSAQDAGLMPNAFISGNYHASIPNATQEDITSVYGTPEDGGPGIPNIVNQEFTVPSVATQSAAEAYDLVLGKAGAFPRDSTTRRNILDAINGTGGWVTMDTASTAAAKQYPRVFRRIYRNDPNDLSLEYPSRKVLSDSDNDGMPDAWETAKGLDPSTADHNGTDLSADGYTNIEVYINTLADTLPEITWISASIPILNMVENNDLNIAAYPNPFSGQVMFVLRESFVVRRNPAVKIFSIDGTLVRQISSQDTKHEARRTVLWDGLDNNGKKITSGIYFAKLKMGNNDIASRVIMKY